MTTFARVRSSIWVRIALAAIGWRVFTALVAFLVNTVVPMAEREQFTIFPRTNLFWDAFARWDSGWFFGIARYGYEWTPGGRSNLAYFPVYPLLMRYVALAMGGGRVRVYMAGILVSWTAFVLAMVVLYRLASLDLREDEARRAIVYAAVFPFAFFFGVVYSEATFLLFMLCAFYFLRTKRWLAAGLAGALATATRANGMFILPSLAIVAWQQTRGNRREQWLAALSLVMAAWGIGLYSLYVYLLTGSPVEWAGSMSRWNWHPGTAMFWTPLWNVLAAVVTRPYEFLTSSPQATVDLLNAAAATSLLVATPFIWLRFGFAYALLVFINLYVPLSSGALEGMGRYSAVLFPFSLCLARIRSPLAQSGILAGFGVLYLLCLTLFTKVYPLF